MKNKAKQSATNDAKKEFKETIKGKLPRAWVSTYIDKHHRNLRGCAAYNLGKRLENIRDGYTAPTRTEMENIKSLIVTNNSK